MLGDSAWRKKNRGCSNYDPCFKTGPALEVTRITYTYIWKTLNISSWLEQQSPWLSYLACGIICGHLQSLFKLCPLCQNLPRPWSHQFYVDLFREYLYKSSCLKPQGFHFLLCRCKIGYGSSIEIVHIIPLSSKSANPCCGLKCFI